MSKLRKDIDVIVNYIVGERTGEVFGQSRYQKAIYTHLKDKVEFNVIDYRGLKFPLLSLAPKHLVYPRITRKKLQEGVVHIASHEQAHVLDAIGSKNSIVTVFDIFTMHMLGKNIRKEYGRLNYLLHKLDVPIWARALAKAEKIITISEFTKKEVVENLKYPSERVEATHLGVDSKAYRPIRDFKKPNCFKGKTILYSGTEDFRKNVPSLIKAFYKLKKKLPDVKMVKVGKPGCRLGRKKLLKLITKLGLNKDVTFVGYVPEDELPLFYNSADLFVFPSIYEGFGLPPLEAMACGLPVITSNASSLPEVVGDAGIMKDPHDIDGFANSMYEVLTNDGLREDMIKRGLKRAKSFSWEKTAMKTLRIYEEISRAR